jgi:hypothetical protein
VTDLAEAVKYFKLSADQGNMEAQFKYAVYLTESGIVHLDWIEAARYFRLAAGFGSEPSGDETLLESGAPLNPEVARRICDRFTGSPTIWGSPFGRWLEIGQYTKKDVKLAARFYSLAGSVGDSDAQANYGFCLEHGIGVKRSPSRSVEFYEKSMRQGNPIGAGQYALSIHFGVGCCEDVESALDHYDFVIRTESSFLTDNSARCFRGLNRLPPEKREITPSPDLSDSAPPIDMADLIRRFQVDPIGSIGGPILGRGASGTVTREKDPKKPANQIAVKRFHSSRDWHSFLREVETLVNLQHPCIIQILGWSPPGSNSFELQMKLAAKGTLTDHLVPGSQASLELHQNATRQACLICDIVLGLKDVHSRGIIPRDLKPDNLLIDENWRVMISDFGLSRWQSATGLPSPYAGSFEYAAPEQWEARDPYTEKVDVFTFGLIAYEILTGGRVPRTGGYRLPVPPPNFAPPLMQNLIKRCWSLDPSERPSFQDILNEFEMNRWGILPGVDAKIIQDSVSEVIKQERVLNPYRF